MCRQGFRSARCAAAIASLKPEDKRGELIEWHGATIINDCYNSNPEALKSMIGTLAGDAGRAAHPGCGRDAGAGHAAAQLHRECGEAAEQAGIDVVIGVRGLAQEIVDGAKAAADSKATAIFVETPQAAGEWLKRNLKPGDAVLLKASRGVRLEQALTTLTAG